MTRSVLLLSLLLPSACGARVATGSDGGGHDDAALGRSDTGASGDTGASRDTGTSSDVEQPQDAGDDCGQPAQPVYACAGAVDAGATCHPYGEDAGATYSQGCNVTLTTCDVSFGSPLTCTCQLFPGNDAGPVWICAI
jgi:hypothetical protein